ncbi:hypothetical protein J6590_058333 [Homalodisca vitripennis]|nr:hypothetical protein J6590_058333 [Homalodisca vitripennis]
MSSAIAAFQVRRFSTVPSRSKDDSSTYPIWILTMIVVLVTNADRFDNSCLCVTISAYVCPHIASTWFDVQWRDLAPNSVYEIVRYRQCCVTAPPPLHGK